MMVFLEYGEELELLRDQYEQEKENPPIQRSTPRVSGNIGMLVICFISVD